MAGRGQKALIPTSEEQEISVAWRVEDLNEAQEGIAQEGETVAWGGHVVQAVQKHNILPLYDSECCTNGSACRYEHSESEVTVAQDLPKSFTCSAWKKGACQKISPTRSGTR